MSDYAGMLGSAARTYALYSAWNSSAIAKYGVVYTTLSGSAPSTTGWRRPTGETALLWCILAVTAVVYLRSLANAFVLDDVAMLVRNPNLGDWSFVWKAFTREEFWYSDADFLPHFRNYRPLLLVFYWINYQLFGLNPAPWHGSVVLIHLVAVWLVFKISRRLTGESTPALLASALFALTPIHAQAVVWIASSGVVLGTAFGLAAFYLIMPRAEGTARNWAVAIALYAGALLSHESAIAFPALVACYAFLFYEDDSDAGHTDGTSLWARARRAVIWQAPFAIELLLYLFTRRLVLGFFVSNPYVHANLLTDVQAVLTVPLVLVDYLSMLAMPWLTLPGHRVPPVSNPSSPEFWVPLTAVIILVTAFLVFALHSPRRRLYLFGAAWIGVTLTPMMLLHSLYHLVQDMYLYLPSVGWCLLLGDLIASVALKNASARRLAVGGASALLVVYALALWRAEPFWHDDVAAAAGYVEGSPDSVAWRLTLAVFLEQKGDLARAEQEIRNALRLEPDRTGTIHPSSKGLHLALGELLAKRGDIDGAELEFRKGISSPADEDEEHPSETSPRYDHGGFALYDRGLLDAGRGRFDQAIHETTQGLNIMERYPVPEVGPFALRYAKLAGFYDSIGNQQQVETVLKEVDSMPEGELAAGLARATIRLNHSDKEGAERILRELSERYPDNAQVLITLGDVQSDLKQNDQALVSYQRAIANRIGQAQLHTSIAKTLHALGRDREALDQCRLALALGLTDWATQFSCAEIRTAAESH
jgi:tetratricopeptide (TPR) repeat protein